MIGASTARRENHALERMTRAVPMSDVAAGVSGAMAANAPSPTINNMDIWERMEREGIVTTDKPVEEAEWSPADLAVAPIGAVGVPAKAAAMALDALPPWRSTDFLKR